MMNRKEFIQTGLRLSVLTGIVGGSLFLVSRNKVDFTCSENSKCKSCTAFTGCELDKAKQSRQDER